MPRSAPLLPLLLLAACSGSEERTDDPRRDRPEKHDTGSVDSGTDTHDTSPMDDTIELPASPLPITLQIGGAERGTATFDTIVCSHPPNDQFQLTYTDSSNAYTWTMRVFVRETFAGRGEYSSNVQVQFFENFSGGRYFATDSSTGSVVVDVDDFGVNGAYGTTTFGDLTGDGTITLSPQPVAFWCDAIDD